MSKWYYSVDPEDNGWYPGGDSREEAINKAKEDYPDYGFHVARCISQDFNLALDGYDILNELQGHNEDIDGEDNDFLWDSVTDEQKKDLGDMVTAAIYAWVDKHKINIEAHCFASIEDQEFIP